MTLLGLPVLLFAAAQAPAPGPRFVPFRLLVTTTSDWTEVRFPGRAVAMAGTEVRTSAPGLEVRGLHLGRPRGDSREVAADFLVYLEATPDPEISLEVRKGDGGETRVEVRPVKGKGTPVTFSVKGTKAGDPTNATPCRTRIEDLYRSDVPLMRLTRKREAPKKVLAFYYPWYGNPDGPSRKWLHWDPSLPSRGAAHRPRLGTYDSLDPVLLRAHLDMARKAGLDGFIVSWWGMGDHSDRCLDLLLKEAARTGHEIGIYVEEARTPRELETMLHYLVRSYGKERALLRAENLPAIFFYSRVLGRFPPADFAMVFRALARAGSKIFPVADGLDPGLLTAFEGLHTYNPVDLPPAEARRVYLGASLTAALAGKLFAATVLPGYDDRSVRGPGRVVERRDGALYREYWDAALAAEPDWILVTSFNEWHEGTEIEPSEEHGEAYLRLTLDLGVAWRRGGIPPAPGR